MALDTNDEILQDFMVEAEEILDKLNEQLVALESQPDNRELLNAIFRGFHTIKGGAGFLNLEAMVSLCHQGEDVFNLLRQGERHVDAQMMDSFLKVHDVLTDMFSEIKFGQYPSPAEPALLQQLAAYLDPNFTPAPPTEIVDVINLTDPTASDDITDEEFEALLDQLHGTHAPGSKSDPIIPDPPKITADDEITEAEFEALLDELQGKKPAVRPQQHDTIKVGTVSTSQEKTVPATASSASPVNAETNTTKPITNNAAETSVRVDTARLDEIMNMVGELVLVRNRINTLEAAFENEEMAKAINHLAMVTADLQTAVMKTRMQPIKKVFGRFPRVVRDLARNLNKEIDMELHGEETDLDKNLVEALADPLVHLVRNAVDHGIESPDTREAAGKSRQGRIMLSAAQEGDHILLTITDDGAGMDPDVLRRKAVEKGMMETDAAARLSEAECFALIFHPGFSLKQEISDISGRGVGMDVVKTSIAKLNGVIDIQSILGKGTTLTIKVPLTLAIMPTLMVMLGQQIFAFPLVNVNEIFNLDSRNTNTVNGQQTIMVRDKVLPLFYLRDWLTAEVNRHEVPETEHVVIVTVGTQKVGFVVDKLLGQEEVVIKPLGALLENTRGFAGATITGDGSIALILDFPELMATYGHRLKQAS